MNAETLRSVKDAAAKRVLFLPHAVKQMSRGDRMISTGDVRRVIQQGEIIEDYPHDPRGHSCLMLGFDAGANPVHIVCAPKDDYLAVITAYRPDARQWTNDFKTRKRK